jgi:hypothetical protein
MKCVTCRKEFYKMHTIKLDDKSYPICEKCFNQVNDSYIKEIIIDNSTKKWITELNKLL